MKLKIKESIDTYDISRDIMSLFKKSASSTLEDLYTEDPDDQKAKVAEFAVHRLMMDFEDKVLKKYGFYKAPRKESVKINEAKSKKLRESISSSDFDYLLATFENEKKYNKALENVVSVSYKGNTVIFSGLYEDEAKNLIEDLEEHVAWALEVDTSASIRKDGTVLVKVFQ